MSRSTLSLALLSALSSVACGSNVSPASDAAPDQHAPLDSDAAIDARDAGERDAVSTDRIAPNDSMADAAEATDAADESLRTPFSRVEFVDTALRRSDQWEALRARRFEPSGGGTWRRTRSRNCHVEFAATPIYTPFADAVELRSIVPEGTTQTASLRPDNAVEWWGAASTYYPGNVLRVRARRSDWPAEWTTDITVPTSVIVTTPTFEQALELRYSSSQLFRWSSMGVSPDAIVRITYSQRRYGASRVEYDESLIICEFEAWRGQATMAMSDHPDFPSAFEFPNNSIVVSVDTVLKRTERLPNGEPVIVEEQANSAVYAPRISP
jgi:hypothetical protein